MKNIQKILVADKISPVGVQFLKDCQDVEVIEAYGSTPEQLLSIVNDVSAILVRSETKVTREIIAAAPKLVCVGRAGVGIDNIDIEAATERGIIVMNTPSGNTIATAELTFTHLLNLARPFVQASTSMHAGKWDRKKLSGIELHKKTLGILGLGRVGTEVAKRALAFGMKVLAYDPFLTETRAKSLNISLATLDEIFSSSDFITVHMPLNDKTKDMVDAAAFQKMKPGVRIINCARGGIINEQALEENLKSGKVAAAGLDVYIAEPLAEDSSLRKIENLNLTPHLGASTFEAQESVGIEIAQAAYQVLSGGPAINAINMPSIDPSIMKHLAPYLILGEKLGTLIRQLSSSKVEKLRVTYSGKVSEFDTMPLSRAIQRGYLKEIIDGPVNDVNSTFYIKRLGISLELIHSNEEADFVDLIKIEAFCDAGKTHTIAGTIIGNTQTPHIVNLEGRRFDFVPEGVLLVLETKDVPGIVGTLGTILGADGVNIANLSLCRDEKTNNALSVYQLDSFPSINAMSFIKNTASISSAKLLKI